MSTFLMLTFFTVNDKQQLSHLLSNLVDHILYGKVTVIQFPPKNDTSPRCNWKAALLFGNRFVLK